MQIFQNKSTGIKWRFIVNPMAAKGAVGRRWEKIERLLHAAGISFDHVFTKRKLHAVDLAKEAIGNGCRHLVAVGGDGTAHEVANGICQQKTCPPASVTFAMLPIGTGNDWIKTHRIPKKFHKWLACFKNGKTVFQDIGYIVFQNNNKKHKRYFINVAGLSYDGYLVKKSLCFSTFFSGALYYLELTARCLFTYKIPAAAIVFNNKKNSGKYFTINIGIGRYSGGGMQLVPHAVPDDGCLALTLAGNIKPFIVLLVSPLFYFGKIGWHPKVEFYKTKKVEIKQLGKESILVEADGEFLGEAPVEIGVAEKGLKIIVPS
ncbi:MAG TPA: diacylglycerol kinase family lipid kinase [Bacteroidetes bacterium]|nr:diacylglycerol kinase family lipid kinase [Bacteroidota bacterium]